MIGYICGDVVLHHIIKEDEILPVRYLEVFYFVFLPTNTPLRDIWML